MYSRKILLEKTLPLFSQNAQAHRKPRWLPVAKSKIYRIPNRPVITQEEKVELKRINDNHNVQMRSIRRFFHDEMMKEKLTLQSASSEMSIQLEKEDWEHCITLNQKWNEKIAIQRQERRELELSALKEKALLEITEKDNSMLKKIESASEEIRKQKELSTSFITPETLESAIENAIANPRDYNYALDLQGNMYIGRDTPAFKTKDEVKNTSTD